MEKYEKLKIAIEKAEKARRYAMVELAIARDELSQAEKHADTKGAELAALKEKGKKLRIELHIDPVPGQLPLLG